MEEKEARRPWPDAACLAANRMGMDNRDDEGERPYRLRGAGSHIESLVAAK
jgi:hypothetical protein